ncbi:MAG: DUF4982 domain-containing protein [Lachnospiraceae bacterium]|nr:DUF4982 domain-containing protein [Lachnospiraceae bacterium]
MKKRLFNENWVCSAGSGSALASLLGSVGNQGTPVTLPHDAVIHTKRVKDDPIGNGMGFYRGETIHYTKDFYLPEEAKGKEVWLEFEGIYQNAYVYINNSFAARCTYGYGNYFINATALLDRGGRNQIKVVVKNGLPSGRWYTGGGIYRDVQMWLGDPLHIACCGVRICTLDLEEDQAVVRVTVPIEYSGTETKDVIVYSEITDPDGNTAAWARTPVTVLAGEKKEIRQQMVVENPLPWETEHPDLYQCRTRLEVNGECIDEYEDTFGIRILQLDVRKGLRINGKSIKLRGGCIHHDHGILGAAAYEEAEERKVKKLKEAGYNAIRMSHYPAGKALLRACDRNGMLVMDEFTDVWTTTKMDFDYGFHFDLCWEQDVENMVYKDYNHPSVILYSIGNEIPETGNKFDSAWGKKITDKIRSLDDTRYTINCVNLMLSAMGHMDEIFADLGVNDDGSPREINSMMQNLGEMMAALTNHEITTRVTEEAFSQVDIAGYNYAANRYESDIERFPNRILLGSETHAPELAYNWSLVKKYPQILGDFAWTAWDYLGEAGVGQITYGDDVGAFYGAYPWRSAYAGAINLIGDRRPVSYFCEIVWGLRKEPYIAVQPPQHYGEEKHLSQWALSDGIHSWNWSGYEGKPITVEVYAQADEVELFVNGISAGRKAAGEKQAFLTEFDITYMPGEIRAVAYNGGIITEQTLLTAADDAHIKLNADGNRLQRGGKLAFVEISLTDGNGTLNPETVREIHVDVEGPADLIGLGSADPKSENDYWDNTCAVFEGRALAVIRSGNDSGTAIVKVRTDKDEQEIPIEIL